MTDADHEVSPVVEHPAPRHTLSLVGELEDADAVRTSIWSASDGFTKSIRVDLSDVTYLPSVVIGVLYVSMNVAKDAGVAVEVAMADGSPVQRNLQVTLMPHVIL